MKESIIILLKALKLSVYPLLVKYNPEIYHAFTVPQMQGRDLA